MSKTKEKIARLSEEVVSRPFRYISLCVLLILLTAPFVYKLESDYGVRIWFRTTDPLIEDLNALEQKFGNDESVIIAVHSPSGIFQPKNVKVIQNLTEKVWLLPDVIRVDSLANFNYTEVEEDDMMTEPFFDDEVQYSQKDLDIKREKALKDPMIIDQFLSKDAKTTLIFGQLKPDINGSPDYRYIVTKTKEMMKDFKGSGDLSYHFVGAATINDAYREVSENDLKVMMPVNFLTMFIFLLFVFRTTAGVLIPLALVGVTITMTMGISALMGFDFNNLSSAIPGILIAICMADTIHILSTYYRSLKFGADRKEAARKTIQRNFMPTLLTSITTSIGFISLTQTELIPVKHLGWLAGMGTFLAWILTIFLICPLLPLIPYKPVKLKMDKKIDENLATRYISWLSQYKYFVVTIITISAGFSIYLGLQNNVNSDPLNHFAKDLKVSKDSFFLLDTFNGVGGPQVMVDCEAKECIKNPEFLEKVDQFVLWLEERQYVNKVTSITTTIKLLNQRLHQDDPQYFKIPETREAVAETLLLYSMGLPQGMDLNNQMSIDNRFLKLGIMWSLHDAGRSLNEIEKINKKAGELGIKISVTGKLTLYHRMTEYIVKAFFKSISIALILISIMLLITLQSWKLGFLSLLPNVVPLMFGAGLMTLVKMDVDIGTSLVITVCLGIAVDDTIHFLAHFKDHLKEEGDLVKALVKVFQQTAPPLIYTTIILTLSFGAFSFADFIPNVNFGILCSVILTMALVIDLIYLPAILLCFKSKKE